MNKEEIEELKEFTIDITDIDELALGLEVCSKKSNMVIQEFANLIIELQQENKKYKEVIDKAIMYIHLNKQKTIGAYGDNEDDDFEIELWEEDIDKLLDILKEVKL